MKPDTVMGQRCSRILQTVAMCRLGGVCIVRCHPMYDTSFHVTRGPNASPTPLKQAVHCDDSIIGMGLPQARALTAACSGIEQFNSAQDASGSDRFWQAGMHRKRDKITDNVAV